MNRVELLEFFNEFQKGSPHHLAAVKILENELPDHLLNEDSDWIVCFNAATWEEYNDKDG